MFKKSERKFPGKSRKVMGKSRKSPSVQNYQFLEEFLAIFGNKKVFGTILGYYHKFKDGNITLIYTDGVEYVIHFCSGIT